MTLPSGEGSIRVMRLDNRAASIDSLSYSVTQQGGSVTFEPIDGEGMSTMSATVNRDGTMLAMKGTTGASGNGWRMTAVMSVSKPE